jgi:valyl-tRNA synthetase
MANRGGTTEEQLFRPQGGRSFYFKEFNMTINLPKTYDFQSTEQRLYDWWEKRGYFQPFNDPNKPDFDPNVKPYVISIPPPNVTGELHLGHAMFVAMEDLMIRHARMKGLSALWVPGTDHASIATQLLVERYLLETEEVTREELGREEFLKRAWQWKEKYGTLITRQIRRLGASCDWSRERFTLDEQLSNAVREAFVRLYEKGLIYRGKRLINWSPQLKTAVSDLEVEYSEENGTLYFFKYILSDGSGDFIPVATTRPETILGDTAVAVHPEDDRYRKFVGKTVLVPILGRQIPVISDTYVDREFGTGALKITPAHDPNDYTIGENHKLEMISVLDQSARINENGGPYAGMDRFDCRKKIWTDMREAGLVIREQPYKINVPRSQRGGEIVEPMISTQWFIRIQPLADAALEAVRSGKIKFVPEHFTKVYYNWLENIQDWCISRQLWWGHRIPVWYCADCGEITVARQDPANCGHCGSTKINQDPDVLDTWFSSGLWPFSTLGWPETTPDMKYFYPTTMMETGYDILFFWVARMIMFGLEFTGEPPFSTVYLHGLFRDEHGEKMSKTKGNVIDPLLLMNDLGTDALRFSVLVGSAPGNDTVLSVKKVEANRNFANKVWNAGRYVISAIESELEVAGKSSSPTLADRWILSRLNELVRSVDRLFESHQYGEAGRQIYEFFWSEFADWYIEISKQQIAQGGFSAAQTARILARVLDTSLRLLHPFTPFVTEELWGYLKQAAAEKNIPSTGKNGDWEDALVIARWPAQESIAADESETVQQFSLVMELVRAIRNLRVEQGIQPGRKLPVTFFAGGKTELLRSQEQVLCSLAHLDREKLTISSQPVNDLSNQYSLVVSGVEIFLPKESAEGNEIDRSRLEKDLQEAESQAARLEKLLVGDFATRAPASLVEKERVKLSAYLETITKIKKQLS